MGLFDAIRGQFIDIIEWQDDSSDTLVHHFDRRNSEIKNGAKLTVRPSQVAVFVNEGQIADVFGPGMYELATKNLPILSDLKGWKYGFESPFKADVYFVSTKLVTDLKWGTSNPIMMRDQEFGMVRIRAFGAWTLRVNEPKTFVENIAGTAGTFEVDGISEQIRHMVVARFSETVGTAGIAALDLSSHYDELARKVKAKLNPEFTGYGLAIETFVVENISLPDEVEKAIDNRTRMGVLGDLNKYAQLQTADSIPTAAANPGGLAGAGMGMGLGVAMGGQMAGLMGGAFAPQAQAPAPPPLPGAVSYHVALDGQQVGPFPASQLQALAAQGRFNAQTLVWSAGMAGWTAAGQVPGLAAIFSAPPPLPPMAPPPMPGT